MEIYKYLQISVLCSVVIFNSLKVSAQTKYEYVEIVGIAHDVKGGAIVQTDSIDYWVEGKDSWEEKYFQKKIAIEGVLKYRKDNRVFVDTSDLVIQGIPVKTKEAKDNYPLMVWIIPSRIQVLE